MTKRRIRLSDQARMPNSISSRTPEGLPNRCPVCGAEVWLEPSLPAGDAPCPHCGQLLWFLRTPSGVQFWEHEEAAALRERLITLVAENLGVEPEQVQLDRQFLNDVGADSLDTAELIMELEEEFGLDFGDDDFSPDE